MSKSPLSAPFALVFFVLILLHNDLWLQNDGTLWLGILPVSFAYHVLYCLVAAATLTAAVRWAWPEELDPENTESLEKEHP